MFENYKKYQNKLIERVNDFNSVKIFRMGLESGSWKVEVDNPDEIEIPYADKGVLKTKKSLKSLLELDPLNGQKIDIGELYNLLTVPDFCDFEMGWLSNDRLNLGAYLYIGKVRNHIIIRLQGYLNSDTWDNYILMQSDPYAMGDSVSSDYSNFIWNKTDKTLTFKDKTKFGSYFDDGISKVADILFFYGPDIPYSDIGIIKPDSDSISINNGRLEVKTDDLSITKATDGKLKAIAVTDVSETNKLVTVNELSALSSGINMLGGWYYAKTLSTYTPSKPTSTSENYIDLSVNPVVTYTAKSDLSGWNANTTTITPNIDDAVIISKQYWNISSANTGGTSYYTANGWVHVPATVRDVDNVSIDVNDNILSVITKSTVANDNKIITESDLSAVDVGVSKLTAGSNITLNPVNGKGDVEVAVTDTGVTKLVAGTNITLSPTNGKGEVTVTASAPAGITTIKDQLNTMNLTGSTVTIPYAQPYKSLLEFPYKYPLVNGITYQFPAAGSDDLVWLANNSKAGSESNYNFFYFEDQDPYWRKLFYWNPQTRALYIWAYSGQAQGTSWTPQYPIWIKGTYQNSFNYSLNGWQVVWNSTNRTLSLGNKFYATNDAFDTAPHVMSFQAQNETSRRILNMIKPSTWSGLVNHQYPVQSNTMANGERSIMEATTGEPINYIQFNDYRPLTGSQSMAMTIYFTDYVDSMSLTSTLVFNVDGSIIFNLNNTDCGTVSYTIKGTGNDDWKADYNYWNCFSWNQGRKRLNFGSGQAYFAYLDNGFNKNWYYDVMGKSKPNLYESLCTYGRG